MRLVTNIGGNKGNGYTFPGEDEIPNPEDPEVVAQMLKENNKDLWQYFYDGERNCFYRDSSFFNNSMFFGETEVKIFVAF